MQGIDVTSFSSISHWGMKFATPISPLLNLFLVVRVWVFLIQYSSPFPAIWLGRDIRRECGTKIMGIGNSIGNKSVLPW